MMIYFFIKKLFLHYFGMLFFFELNKTNKIFKKKTDTIFILGSGSTINEIGQEEWLHIKKNTSVGFNYFMFHDFIPDSYLIEPERKSDFLMCRNLIKLIKIKKEYLSKTKVIMHRMGCYKILKFYLKSFKINYKLFTPFDFGFKNVDKLDKILNSFFLSLINIFFVPAQGCASVERIVLSAYLSGYKKIVLCGVDLNNNEYFFYEKTKYKNILYKNARIIKKENNKHHAKNIHATNDINKAKQGIKISEILKVYNNYFKRNNVELYILNKKSVLSEFLPTYKIKN
jgi:hypothetical protein